MDPFTYRGGTLHAEAVDLSLVASEVGTPVYCYSRAAIESRYRAFLGQLAPLPSLVCYAVKANSNQAVLRVLARLGAGMDVVSEGELRRARTAGVPGQRITFSGVGKTEREMAYALDEDILCFNVESEAELEGLSSLASAKGIAARVAVRVNPDIDARTHAKISTGKADNKFGVPLSRARALFGRAASLPGIRVTGVDMHIGSQITDLAPYRAAFAALAGLVRALRADGHAIDHADVGGGLGIAYRPGEPAERERLPPYAALLKEHFSTLDLTVVCEPGRFLVGNAGALLTTVVLVKHGADKTFVVVDAAMNDLIRPTLYEAHHAIVPLREPPPGTETRSVDVVGPVCETGDYLATGRDLPEVGAGDRLAVLSAGAYGAVQAGTYNSRLLVPEVLVDGATFDVIRPRLGYEALLGLDRVPGTLG